MADTIQPWDKRELLAYIPRPLVQKIRYVILRAGEMKSNGAQDANNGFYQSIVTLKEAIDATLEGEGFTVAREMRAAFAAMSAAPAGAPDSILTQQLEEYEQELDANEATIRDQQAQIADLQKQVASYEHKMNTIEGIADAPPPAAPKGAPQVRSASTTKTEEKSKKKDKSKTSKEGKK